MDKQFKVGDKVLHRKCDKCIERLLTVDYRIVLNEDGTVHREGQILKGDAANSNYFAWLDVERAYITPYGS